MEFFYKNEHQQKHYTRHKREQFDVSTSSSTPFECRFMVGQNFVQNLEEIFLFCQGLLHY